MSKQVPINALVETTGLDIAVTGAPGGAGVAAAYSAATSNIVLTNTSPGCGLQYKVGAGAWIDLQRSQGVTLAVDMSSTAVYLRRATFDGGIATVHLHAEGKAALRLYDAPVVVDGSGGGSTTARIPVTVGRALQPADSGQFLRLDTANISMTVPLGLSPVGFTTIIRLNGTNAFIPEAGVTLNGGTVPLYRLGAAPWRMVALVQTDTNKYDLNGIDAAAPATDADYDAYAAAVLATGAPLTSAEQVAWKQWFSAVKSGNVWNKIDWMIRPSGPTRAQAAVPAKVGSGAALATLFNMVDADYSPALGVKTDGTTKLLKSGTTIAGAVGLLAMGLGTAQGAGTTSKTLMGAAQGVQHWYLTMNASATGGAFTTGIRGKVGGDFGVASPQVGNGNVAGRYAATRRGSNDAELFFNQTSIATNTATATTAGSPVAEIYGLARNGGGTADQFCDANTFLKDLMVSQVPWTLAEWQVYDAATTALNTALGG